MSIISTAYDALVTRIGTVLSSHIRIADTLFLEKNPELALNQGWGIIGRGHENTNRDISCKISLAQTFSILVTRKLFVNDFDVGSKATVEKNLFEDRDAIIADIEADPTLATSVIARYVSTTEPTSIFADQDNFRFIDVSIVVEYFRDLN